MPRDVVIRMAGTAGEGALVLGDILAQALAGLGWDLLLYFSFEAEVRGEKPSFSQLRVSDRLPLSQGGSIDLLLGLNKNAFELNLPALSRGGTALYDGRPIDPFSGETPYTPALSEGVRGVSVPFEVISQKEVGFPAAKNMAALGALAKLLGMPYDFIRTLVTRRFARKGEKVTEANLRALELGHSHDIPAVHDFGKRGGPKLLLSGNRASALGAMSGGLTFFAGYPITPATEVMEYLAGDLPSLGGTVIQAEDEISALGMVLGASFAGARAMTATSGPGLSLMSEMLGLASAAEVPAVVLDVQRGGPSTGLPTRPEQSDLDLALYGGHGDTTRIVLAPTDVEECFHATGMALGLARKYQMPVIVLSDQYLGYRRETMDNLGPEGISHGERLKPAESDLADYKRYRLTENGISPMSVPGEEGGYFVATGLEHDEYGAPAYDPDTHRAMQEKRLRKLKAAGDERWFFRHGPADADVGVMAWGSVVGAAREAVEMANISGAKAALFYTVILNPLPEDEIRGFVKPIRRLIVPELNHTGQFARLLRARFLIEPVSLAWAGAGPFPAHDIYEKIMEHR
jgi:2-oxoglutarate ferredoxin oxidoreductase subunit alpha